MSEKTIVKKHIRKSKTGKKGIVRRHNRKNLNVRNSHSQSLGFVASISGEHKATDIAYYYGDFVKQVMKKLRLKQFLIIDKEAVSFGQIGHAGIILANNLQHAKQIAAKEIDFPADIRPLPNNQGMDEIYRTIA